MLRYIVTLRPVESNGPQRERYIMAQSLSEAQDLAYEEYGPHAVFDVRERRPRVPPYDPKMDYPERYNLGI